MKESKHEFPFIVIQYTINTPVVYVNIIDHSDIRTTMKIALCLYGHLRGYEKCLPTLKKYVLDVYNPDVYVMTWLDSYGWATKPCNSQQSLLHPGYSLDSEIVKPSTIKKIINYINPTDMHFDHFYLHNKRFLKFCQEHTDGPMPFPEHRPKGTISQNYARNIVTAMKRNHEDRLGIDYDYVICTRWDVEYLNPIDITQLNPNILTFNAYWWGKTILIHDTWVSGPSQYVDVWGDQLNGADQLSRINEFIYEPHEWGERWLKFNAIPWDYSTHIVNNMRRESKYWDA